MNEILAPILTPNPKTLNPKPKTLNPKPQGMNEILAPIYYVMSLASRDAAPDASWNLAATVATRDAATVATRDATRNQVTRSDAKNEAVHEDAAQSAGEPRKGDATLQQDAEADAFWCLPKP
jgi:hypothetical protein